MSGSENLQCITVPAGADLSSSIYRAMKLGNDKVLLVAASNSEPIVGILQNKPTSGQAGQLATAGISKGVAGGSISSGDKLTATTGGALIATTTNNHYIVGHAMEDAASGDVFQVFLTPGMQHGA